jgi:putative transposase
VIAKTAIKKHKKNRKILKIYSRYLKHIRCCNDKNTLRKLRSMDKLKNDCRILYDRGEWYLVIPLDKKLKQCTSDITGVCALDPGVRKFQTIYSPDRISMVETNKLLKRKLYTKLDKLRSSRAKNLISEAKYTLQTRQIQRRITNLTDDMHYRLINYLLDNYKVIHIPEFETTKLCKRLHRTTNRDMFSMKHYTFRSRLLHCAGQGYKINVCNESYTSKTCTRCGLLNHNLKNSEVFKCTTECGLVVDRDINGARNIFLKHEY